jgi:DNA-binding transcriptional MerR regulator
VDATATANLPIRTISSLTGVNAVTLRAWERRYGLVRPARTPKGHRLYSYHHVERIRRVLALMERGVPIGRVRDLIDVEPAPEPAAAGSRWQESLQRMATAIANFDEPELDRIYEEVLGIYPVEQVTRALLLPLLVHLGERWRDLAGGIAEEHFFSMYLRSKLGARLQHRMRYAVGPRVLASCAPGEQHEIGLLLFALQAHAAGLQTVLLGADTPLDEIVIARRRSASRALVLSSSLPPAKGFLSGDLPRLVREAGCPVFVGGDTAQARRREIAAAGATPLCVPIEEGVRILQARLEHAKDAS